MLPESPEQTEAGTHRLLVTAVACSFGVVS
jgi:hypothetical protein